MDDKNSRVYGLENEGDTKDYKKTCGKTVSRLEQKVEWGIFQACSRTLKLQRMNCWI